MEKFARRCDATGRGMNEGYVVGDGERYFSEKQHLIDWLRSRGGMDELSDEFILNESYELEEYYYTEWDEEINENNYDCYYDEEGNEYEF
jgi:hypothetical protein